MLRPPNPPRRAWPLLVLSVALLSLSAASAPTASAAADAQLATILSPKRERMVTRSIVVRVRVRPATRLRVSVAGKTVTKRFGRARGGVRSARLRRGRELALGLNHIAVEARAGRRRSFNTVDVVVARRQHGFLTLRSALRRSGSRAPLVWARWRSEPHGFRARLNGHNISREFVTRVGTTRRARLGADDGLRFGRNRLVVTAYDSHGRFDRELRRFRIRRTAPLLATLGERRVGTGLPLRLDARLSRPARGGRLSFRWTLTRRPGGSKARLTNESSARPTLVPDVRGRYRVRLRVVERGGRRPAARAAQLQPLSAATTMEVIAPTLPGPMGFPISTIPSGVKGITLDGTTYATTANWVQVSLFDRQTLEPKDVPMGPPAANHSRTGQYVFDTGDDPQLLRNLVNPSSSKIDASYLVVMTGGGRSIPIQKPQWQALTYAFGKLGGTMDPFLNNGKGNSDPGFGNGNWSLIGIPGLSAGSAAQNWNLSPAAHARAGSLDGYLAWDSQSNFAFVAGDYVEFDTNATGQKALTGGTNQMTVGGTPYTSQALPSGQSGFHIVVLDSGTLARLDNRTFVTNYPPGQVTPNVQAMYRLIQSYSRRRANVLFLIQSIGSPNPLNASWTGPTPPSLAGTIETIGGSRDVFNSLAPTASKYGYALVGGTELSPTEAVEHALNPENPTQLPPPARVHGMFKRGDQYGYQPTTASAADAPGTNGFDLSALALAFQPESDSWPTHDTPGHRAAEDYVAREVFYPDYVPPKRGYDLHTYYWYADWLDPSNGYQSAFNLVCPPDGGTVPPDASFDVDDLLDVCSQIRQELVWVQAVWGMAGAVESTFTQQEISGPTSATAIANDITGAMGSQRGSGESEVVADVLLIVGTLLEAASEVVFAEGGNEGLQSAAAIGVMSGLMDMAADFAQSPSGEPYVATYNTEAKNLGSAIVSSYQNAIGAASKLSQLLVSDYAKLSVAGPKAQNPDTWGFGRQRLTQLANSVELSTTRYLWSKLLPGAFKVYNLGAGGRGWSQSGQGNWTPKTYRCFTNDTGLNAGNLIWPFRGAPSSAWQDQTVGIKHGKPYRQPNVLASGKFRFLRSGDGRNHVVAANGAPMVPSRITNPLFQPVVAGQYGSGGTLIKVGLNRPAFFADNQGIFTRVDVAC